MAGKLSDLTPATAYNDADYEEIYQSGNNLSLTKQIRRKFFFGTAIDGQTPRYDSSATNTVASAGNFVLDDSSGYRTVNTGRYVADTSIAPGTTSVIAVTNTDDFETKDSAGAANGTIDVGLPVRFVIGSTVYYAIVTGGTQNVSITIAGASLLGGTLAALAVGPHEKVVQYPIRIETATSYASTATDTKLAVIGNRYYEWSGPKAFLVKWKATHRSATSPTINLLVNATPVSAAVVTLSATPGTWTSCAAIGIQTAVYGVVEGDDFEIRVTGTATATYLDVIATFILA